MLPLTVKRSIYRVVEGISENEYIHSSLGPFIWHINDLACIHGSISLHFVALTQIGASM